MFRRFTKKRLAVVLGAVAALAIAGSAVAYFSTSGTGTGQASVGTAHNFAVSFGTTTGTMYPGTGTSTVPYTIANPTGSGVQNLSATSVAVADDGHGNITDHGTPVSGCSSVWFHAVDSPPAYGEIADSGSKTGHVTVSMDDANVSQDNCKNHAPDINVNAQ
jgi:hypothetical protein